VTVQRLKTREQFQAVMVGPTVSRTPHFALHRRALDVSTSAAPQPIAPALCLVPDVWIGALVPKRWAKRAVTRNAIKRQIYAVSQANRSTLPMAAHVVRLRTGFERKHFVSASSAALKSAVRGELQQLFERAVTYGRAPAAAECAP